MENIPLTTALDRIRQSASAEYYADFSDGALLDRYVSNQDQGAFTVLVERHGALVFSICTRILRDLHDSEDACQATFLILASKASSIKKQSSISCWLHGVARRVSLVLLKKQVDHKKRDLQHPVSEPTTTDSNLTWSEVQVMLDEELESIPKSYREPLILCYLEGKTRDEAAIALGLTQGKLHGLLQRGRTLLKDRLVKRGVTLGGGLLSGVLSGSVSHALPPEFSIRIVNGVSENATLLSKEVLRTMFLVKMKSVAQWVAGVGLVCAFITGGLITSGFAQPQQKPPTNGTEFVTAPIPRAKAKTKEDVLTYASRIEAAHQALKRGNGKEVQAKLMLTNPDLRGWEYDYLLRQSMGIGKEGHKSKQTHNGDGARVTDVAFTQDQRLIVSNYGNVAKVWDFMKGESTNLEGHASSVMCVSVSPDGKKFVTGGWGGKVIIWKGSVRKKLVEYHGHNPEKKRPGDHETLNVQSLCYSPDGKQIVSAAYPNSPFVPHIKPELNIWSTETGKTLIKLKGQHSKGRQFAVLCVSYSPDGKLIASGGFDKTLRLWEAKTGKELHTIQGHKNNVLGVAFSPDGKRIATASTDKTLGVWDLSTGKELLRLKGHTAPVFSVKFSPDGKRILSGCWDRTVKIWDADTGVELFTLGKLPGPIVSIAVSPNGNRIAAGGGAPGRIADATIWDGTPLLKK